MQNDPPSPTSYNMYHHSRTPHAASGHAHYTHSNFLPGSPPNGHTPAYLQPGLSTDYSATPSASAQIGYPYSLSSLDPLSVFPVQPPTYGFPHHKTQSTSTTWSTTPDQDQVPDSPTMAVTIPQSSCHSSSATAAPTSARSSRNDPDGSATSGSASDGGRDSSPPSRAQRQRTNDVKKKIHPCWMCHKSFDRPSTLKKHLLVHTGEKAFACESCGRRFGVASNLNRHAKTCRAANAAASASSSTPPAAVDEARGTSTPQATSTALPSVAPGAPVAGLQPSPADAPSASTVTRRVTRKRKSADVEETCRPDEEGGTQDQNQNQNQQRQQQQQSRSRKRARRAPSPALWVPDSLKAFDLTPMTKGTPVPLPPVRPFQDTNTYFMEERDSFDENAPANPYNVREWTGRLPGPGLLGNNVANRSGGQLLIF